SSPSIMGIRSMPRAPWSHLTGVRTSRTSFTDRAGWPRLFSWRWTAPRDSMPSSLRYSSVESLSRNRDHSDSANDRGRARRREAQGSSRCLEVGATPPLVRLEMVTLGPFVPGVDEDDPFFALEDVHGIVDDPAQPPFVHGRGRTMKDHCVASTA